MTKTNTLSRVQRRRLIEQPFTVSVIQPKSHAGSAIYADVPVEGRKAYTRCPWDEEFYASHKDTDGY